jgi:O-antigen/teichoic acid export membrane protein
MFRKACRATDLILAIAVPVALVLELGADVWVTRLFGEAYAPAVPALRVMAPVFVATYVAMLNSTCLVAVGKAWLVTRVSVGTLILNPLMIATLVPLTSRLGPGGPGVGAALALLCSELVAAGRLVFATRGRTFDAPAAARMVKLAGICVMVVFVDRTVGWIGPARVAADLAAYVILALVLRALPLESMSRLWRGLVQAGAR